MHSFLSQPVKKRINSLHAHGIDKNIHLGFSPRVVLILLCLSFLE